MERITVDRTTIVIAHRLSTIRHADKIIVLEHGSLYEAGTHESLIAAGGIYEKLWKVQTGERMSPV
jgi:ATP-binding cassette subfamily B protein